MDAQHAPAAFHQHVEVTAGLCCLDDAEAVGMARNVEIGGIVAGDLEEDAGVRSALVGLARRMLEARREADAGGGMGGVANARAQRGQRLGGRLIAT
jgi:hypothetical protein